MPYIVFSKNDVIYFVGNRIEAYRRDKRIYSNEIKSEFISACVIGDYIFALAEDGVYKFDYKNNKLLGTLKGNFKNISCLNKGFSVHNDTNFYIFDTDFKKNFTFSGKYIPLNEFLVLSDTISKKTSILSLNNFDTLEIRNFEGFLPYFAKQESVYTVIAGSSKRNFYIYFFENRNLRWYQKISIKVIISDIFFNLEDRTILIYGSSQKTFYINLKDLMGDDMWVYNPKVLGVYFLDENVRGVIVENNKIIAYGYSIREGQKRGVIKIIDYNTGEQVFEHFDNEIEDILKIIKVQNEYYMVGITKKFLGVYRLNLNSFSKSN